MSTSTTTEVLSELGHVMPTPSELESVVRQRRGEFSQIPFAVLLRALAESRQTCVLEVTRRRVVKNIMFESGLPVHCRSNVVPERFGNFLVRIGRLTQAEFAVSFSEALAKEKPLGSVLIEKGILDSAELLRLLQRCLVHQLFDVFTWSEGSFAVFDDPPEAYAPLKVRVHQLLLTGTTRFTPQSLVDQAVVSLIGTKLVIQPKPPVPVADLLLSDVQQLITSKLSEPRNLSELTDEQAPIDEVSRLVYALGVAGLIVPEQRISSLGTTSSSSPASGRSASSATAPAEETSLDAESVTRHYLDHRRLDAFELLGASEDAKADEIDAAFVSYLDRFYPWTRRDDVKKEINEQARALILAGARSYAEVSTSEGRETLRNRRRILREEQEAKRQVGPQRIETELLDPEVQYEKAVELIEAGQVEKALQYLEFATDCEPQNGTYRAQLAWARYTAGTCRPEQALRDLKETRRIDPECGLAFLYAGDIASDLERYEEAEELLHAARGLLDDRRAIESLKTLRARQRSKRR